MKLCPKCNKQFSDDANFCPVDAARLTPIETSAAGEDSLTARFELGPQLGGHRTGAVHRATDKTTGKAVAVKLVSPAVVGLPGVAQRLERELKQLERVSSAGVAKVIASGKRPGDVTWIAMELLDGAQTLDAAIRARGGIPLDQAADLISVIGEALIEAAQVGVVHRDLAPKNILFAGVDVKLVNFSLPVPTDDKVPGVPEFVAPEQVEGRAVDQRSNLYSLGALYYFVLTGQTLFTGSPDEVHKQHAAGSIRPPAQIANIPAALDAVIMRALDRSPTKRFLTVRQLVDEVARVGTGEVVELKQTMAMGKVGKPKPELVQTLLGMRGRGGVGAPISTAATVGLGVPSVAAAPPVAAPAAPIVAAPVLPAAPAPAMPLAQQVQATMVGVPLAATASSGSPWAGPAGQPSAPAPAPPVVAAPIVAAPVVAPPIVAAPIVAPPVLASPQISAAANAAKKKADEPTKGKFRETMWFKKGDLDVQAAEAAAEERARTGKDGANDKVDSLPVEDRYGDDGSISRGDKEKYSLRTGATQMMSAIREDQAGSGTGVSEDALIGEMKAGRQKIFLAIGAGVILLILLIVLITR